MSRTLQLPSSLTVGPLVPNQKLRVTFHESLSHLALTETRRFGILFIYFTLVAEQRSSAMSGATDRREDEQVTQFYDRLDEKFAEWETDVRLWQVEFKVDWDQGCIGEVCMDSRRPL